MNLPLNIAIVHDWLVSMRGGEKCLEALCELFPRAHLFTLVHRRGSVSPIIERMRITTSLLQRMPFGVSRYQWYLPVLPTMAETLDVRDYDLVISSSHAVAKGVRVGEAALHVCYCHTPMRYVWDQYDQYFGKGSAGFATRAVMKLFLSSLRRWDVQTSSGVHHFIANSKNVMQRIRRIYNRAAEVMYPPVDVHRFHVSEVDDGYFLIVSALVPYKRVDLAIEAFNRTGKRLVVVGTGMEDRRLKQMAKSNIEFIGWASDEELVRYYERCRAVIFPGEEDFGIVPVEAMACGKPVVAFGRGGALEVVVENESFSTGVFFHEQSADALIDALSRLERGSHDPRRTREHALQFDRSVFKQRFMKYVERAWSEFRNSR